VIGGESLDQQVAAHLHPCTDRERHDLVPVPGPFEPLGGRDQRRQRLGDRRRAEDAGCGALVQGALRQDEGEPERMVEVAVREEDVTRSRQLRGAAPGVEGEARRADAEPGLVAGQRPALDREIAQT